KSLSMEELEEIKDFLRPVMVSLRNCTNVLLEGCSFQNSPAWNIHPLMCTNLIVKDITVRNPWYAQNGDGIDIESCTNTIIVGSSFDVGDDGICIKSGKDEDGRRRGIPTRGLIVDGCTVYHGHGGFVVGSEMSGGVENVKVSNCRFLGTDVGLRFKSKRGRGGVVRNIWIDNIYMTDIATETLLFDLHYGGKSAVEQLEDGSVVTVVEPEPVDETTPEFRDIYISGVVCNGARRAMYFNGIPEMPVKNVNIRDCTISSTTGIEVNYAEDVTLENVTVVTGKGKAIVQSNVRNFVVK
ncbi:MAG: glycoside hydrolase family 28 protein, partial [Candidatus Cryptobacteroides sp.]